eukprot:scaffold21531_cov63-Phaeocystis_antarctica.AAC.1
MAAPRRRAEDMGTFGAAASARCANGTLLADREMLTAVHALSISPVYMQLKFARSTGPLYPRLLSTLSQKTSLRSRGRPATRWP